MSEKPIGVLERSKTVFGDTGWYGCQKFNSQFFNDNDPDNFRIYVYVKCKFFIKLTFIIKF